MWKRAADFGFSDACKNYALCLFEGIGVEKNSDETFIYFSRYAESLNENPQDTLAKLIEEAQNESTLESYSSEEGILE
jgi:TPR repeat protein